MRGIVVSVVASALFGVIALLGARLDGFSSEEVTAWRVVFIVIALLTDSVWALVAGVARDWFARSPRRIEALGATGGVVSSLLASVALLRGWGRK